MGGHALRGAVTAWLMLIALQTIGTQGGSGRVASFFADADALVKRALDPKVPAIRDRRSGLSAGDTPSPYLNGITPNQLRTGAANAGQLLQPGTQTAIASGLPGQIAGLTPAQIGGFSSLGQYSPEQLAQAWGQG